MTDLQETINPVNNTGANPPENSLDSNPLEWNPWDIQTNSFAEQTEISNQPQEITTEQPVSSEAPDLSNMSENVAVETSLTANEGPINAPESSSQTASSNLPDPQAMINAAKKEKLAQLLKAEWDKWKKSWFIKWILSWVGISLWILAVSVIFAKDQIVDLLSNNLNLPFLQASVTDATTDKTDTDLNNQKAEEDEDIASENENNTTENEEISTETENVTAKEDENISENENNSDEDANQIEEESASEEENNKIFEEYYFQISEIIESDIEDDKKLDMLEQIHKEILSTTPENEELIKYIDQSVMDIYDKISQWDINEESEDETDISTTDEKLENEKSEDENISEEGNTNESDTNNESEDENVNDSDANEWYSITHVNSVEEANWVLPAHCSDLTCYGEDKEFSPCTSFRLAENLDENSHRIGNGGACRYKDASELVYVEFK